jgi:hypothetical protein
MTDPLGSSGKEVAAAGPDRLTDADVARPLADRETSVMFMILMPPTAIEIEAMPTSILRSRDSRSVLRDG